MEWELANGVKEKIEERGEWLERCGSQGTHAGKVIVGIEGMF